MLPPEILKDNSSTQRQITSTIPILKQVLLLLARPVPLSFRKVAAEMLTAIQTDNTCIADCLRAACLNDSYQLSCHFVGGGKWGSFSPPHPLTISSRSQAVTLSHVVQHESRSSSLLDLFNQALASWPPKPQALVARAIRHEKNILTSGCGIPKFRTFGFRAPHATETALDKPTPPTAPLTPPTAFRLCVKFQNVWKRSVKVACS